MIALRLLCMILALLVLATIASLMFDNPEPCSTDTECGCALDCLDAPDAAR